MCLYALFLLWLCAIWLMDVHSCLLGSVFHIRNATRRVTFSSTSKNSHVLVQLFYSPSTRPSWFFPSSDIVHEFIYVQWHDRSIFKFQKQLDTMALPQTIVLWLDLSFDEVQKYLQMKNDLRSDTAAPPIQTPPPPRALIDTQICNEMKEVLPSNGAPVITITSPVEAMQYVTEYIDKKIFFICSGSLGKHIVPDIVDRYPSVQSFYIYCFKMAEHVHWAIKHVGILQMFDHQINLFVQLTRDIASYLIEQGRMFLNIDAPKEALACFNHARTLEIRANVRDKMPPNPRDWAPRPQPDVRTRLDLLEGDSGLIRQAEKAIHWQQNRIHPRDYNENTNSSY